MSGGREGGPVYAVVVPTLVRDTLAECLRALAESGAPRPAEIVVVDDRPGRPGTRPGTWPGTTLGTRPEAMPGTRPEARSAVDTGEEGRQALEEYLAVLGDELRSRTTVLRGGGRGPAAACNTGLWATGSPWIVFLDEDVRVGPHWCVQLAEDLGAAEPDVAGVQGVIAVPLPGERRPTDWERNTAVVAGARWITADMAYRTDALKEVGGFDERFGRTFREGADLAMRVLDAGWRIRRGRRVTLRSVRPADRWASVRAQRGNADDALMLRLHGPNWWHKAAAPRSRIRRHLAVTAAGVAAALLAAAGRRTGAVFAALGWAAGTAEFAWARIAPGPRTRDEITTVAVTSVLIPPAATWYWLRGLWRHRGVAPWREVMAL